MHRHYDNRYKCQICNSAWISFEQTLTHEDDPIHVRELRKREPLNDEPESDGDGDGPADLNPADYLSSPIAAPLEGNMYHYTDEADPFPVPLSPLPMPLQSEEGPYLQSPPFSSVGIHGPAIPGDRPNEIYNNFGGASWQSHPEQHPVNDDRTRLGQAPVSGVRSKPDDEFGLLSILDFEREEGPSIVPDVGGTVYSIESQSAH